MERPFVQILTELQNINQRLDRIESEQQVMKQEIQQLKQDIQEIKQEQQQIKQAVFETNEHVKRLEGIQVNQQRIIELLSARSIQQEAELKRII